LSSVAKSFVGITFILLVPFLPAFFLVDEKNMPFGNFIYINRRATK
jgi:hypothetical protein